MQIVTAILTLLCVSKALAVPDNPARDTYVTSFTVDSNSAAVHNVTEGTTVNFSCDVGGELIRPKVNIKGQRSNMSLPLTVTEFGDFGTRGVGAMEMYCNATDTFICTPSVGLYTGRPYNVTVNVFCAPELNSSSIGDSYYSTIEGKQLKIEVVINSYPPPTTYTLFQIGNVAEGPLEGRKKREAQRNVVPKEVYQTAYVPLEPPQGMVVLHMYNLGKQNSGQYVLKVQNGIGGGLEINFNVNVNKEEKDDDTDIHTIIGTVCGVIGVIGLIVPGVYCAVKKCRKSGSK